MAGLFAKALAKVGQARRSATGRAFVPGLESGMAGFGAARLAVPLELGDPDQDDAGAQHVEILGHPTRDVDDPPPVTGRHPVVDLDDGATLAVQPAHGDHGAEREAIARPGELLAIETLAGRGLAPLEAAAIVTGMPVQSDTLGI